MGLVSWTWLADSSKNCTRRGYKQILPESQSGFKKGCGSVDTIFVRQLVEKTGKYNELLFVDLKKAYDSMPREALWIMLVMCVVPPLT